MLALSITRWRLVELALQDRDAVGEFLRELSTKAILPLLRFGHPGCLLCAFRPDLNERPGAE